MTKKSLPPFPVAARPQWVDLYSEQIVECGIAMQSRYNTMCALEYLKSRNIDAKVIERVLSHPQLRRNAMC